VDGADPCEEHAELCCVTDCKSVVSMLQQTAAKNEERVQHVTDILVEIQRQVDSNLGLKHVRTHTVVSISLHTLQLMIKVLMELYLTATECHLPYGIT